MIKVESYKCEKCGELFSSSEECAKHERESVRKVSIWWRPDTCTYTFSDIEMDTPFREDLVVKSGEDLQPSFVQYCSALQFDNVMFIRFYMEVEGHMVEATIKYLKEWVMDTMKRSGDNALLLAEDER